MYPRSVTAELLLFFLRVWLFRALHSILIHHVPVVLLVHQGLHVLNGKLGQHGQSFQALHKLGRRQPLRLKLGCRQPFRLQQGCRLLLGKGIESVDDVLYTSLAVAVVAEEISEFFTKQVYHVDSADNAVFFTDCDKFFEVFR